MAARARSREVCLFIFPNCVGCEVAQWGAGESTRIRAGTDLNTNHSHTHGTATTDPTRGRLIPPVLPGMAPRPTGGARPWTAGPRPALARCADPAACEARRGESKAAARRAAARQPWRCFRGFESSRATGPSCRLPPNPRVAPALARACAGREREWHQEQACPVA